MNSLTSNSKIIRATLISYIVLSGIWVLLAIGYIFLALSKPGKGLETGAILAGIVSLIWWIWLWGFKLTVSNEYIEYRDGFFRSSKVYLREIADVKNVSIEWNMFGRKIKIPRINVITHNKIIAMRINPKPFGHRELQEILKLLKRSHDHRQSRWLEESP